MFLACYAACGDRETAEDATQEAFARALERWARLADRPWAPGWVMTTGLNVARRMQRRRPRRLPDQQGAPQSEDSVDLWEVVRALPRRQRQAVVLHYAGDLRISEIARVMKCAEGTVKAHLARARESLRARLEDVPDEG